MVTIDSSTLQNLLLDNHLVKEVYAVVYTVNPETQVESQYRVNASSILGYGVRYDSMPTNHIGMGNAIPSSGYIKFLESDISFAASEVDRFKIYETTTGTGVGQQITVGLGTFYPDNYSFDDNVLTFEGYDFLSFLDRDYSESELLDGDQMAAHTPKNWLKRAFVACGFPENKLSFTCENEDAAYTFEELTGTIMPQQAFDTFRTFAACIAGACGCNLIAGRTEGEAVLVSVGGTEDTTYRFPDAYVPISKLFSKGIAFTSIKFKNYSSIATGTKTDIYNITGSYPDGTKEKRYKFGKNPLIDPVAMWDEVNNRRGYLRARNRIIAQLESRLFTRFIYEITSVPVFDIGDRIVVEAGTKNLLITSWSYDGGSVTLSLGDPTSGSSVSTSGGGGLGTITVNGKISAALESAEESGGEVTDVSVVKDSESYLYNALLSQTATDGTVLDKISTKWLHADRKADIRRHIKTGVPTEDGYYRYTIKVALDYMTSATFLGQTALLYSSQLYVCAKDTSGSAYMRIGLKGTATIEFTSEYPNIFTVSGFDATYTTTSPSNYGYVPSLENIANPMLELNRVIGFNDIDILVADIATDAGVYNGIRLYRPKTMTVAERVYAITAEIKKLNVEFVTLDKEIPPWCSEGFLYDQYGDAYKHAWVETSEYNVPSIDFGMCEIDESNTSVNTALDTITIRFDVSEDYRSGDTYIKFLRDIWESSGIQTGIQVTMRVGFDNIGAASTQVPLTNAEIADGIILEGDEYVWASSEDSSYTAYGYLHNETISYPYKRLSIPSYDYNFYGSLINLAKDQNINLKMIEVSGTKKNTNVTHDIDEWVSIDEDLGDKPTVSGYGNLSLSSYEVNQSKLVISDTYDSELGGYEIDVNSSDDEMYELYLDLLDLGSTTEDVEPAHYLESGVGNTYDESYEVIDIIGSGNDLTGTENLGKELTIIGSGNIALNFENYDDGIEGIFLGNFGTGFLITLSGRLVYYEKYHVKDLSGATYTISINGYELTLTNESDETSITVTIPSYTLTRTEGEYTVTLTDSYNTAQEISIEPIWADADDLTNSIDEIFGETVLSTEDGEYYFVTEDSTYKIQV